MGNPPNNKSPGPRNHHERQRYRCDLCDRTYARRDHLMRHRLSHASQRPFVCSDCGKAFTRTDLLLRHSALHGEREPAPGSLRGSIPGFSRRVFKACSPCASAKVKCQDEKPCRRCLKRGITCAPAPSGQSPLEGSLNERTNNRSDAHATVHLQPNIELDTDLSSPESVEGATLPSPKDPILENVHLCSEEIQQDYDKQITSIQTVPDHTEFDWQSLENFFWGSIGSSDGWEQLILTGRIKQAGQAFEGFLLWRSVPEKVVGDENSICFNNPLALEKPYLTFTGGAIPVPPRFNHRTRDDLLVTLVTLAQTQPPECLKILRSVFPSLDELNMLVHFFFDRHDAKVDSWIHSTAFQPNPENWELSAMIVAAGALGTSSPALRQLGSVICRLLRPVILNKLEEEETPVPALHLRQAILLNLELALWHSENTSLYRAGRFLGVIIAFLRETLKGRQPKYENAPLATDDQAELQSKWLLWITAESYNRLTARFCVHDNQQSMALGVRAATTLSEYRLPLPQPKNLWLAKSATEWRQLYLSQNTKPTQRVMDLLSPMPAFRVQNGFLDQGLAMKLIFHSLGGLIVDYHISGASPWERDRHHNEESSCVISRNRKSELKAAISNFEYIFNRDIGAANIGPFIVSYLTMTLEVSVENVEILAGKGGEEESRLMYQTMKDWPETCGARQAIWHAGQILRLFKLIDRVTSFQIIIAYHAGLVLFAYSVLSCVQDHTHQPIGSPTLTLNGTSFSQAEIFIRDGHTECLLQGDFRGTERATASLLATKDTVDVISEIILNRACNCEGLSPRLVNGLVKVLKDLGSAVQILTNDDHIPLALEPGLERIDHHYWPELL